MQLAQECNVSFRALIATGNPAKVREFLSLLVDSGITALFPGDVGLHLEVEETGLTYMENALTKARAYSAASGLPALADDSGLEVDALNGAPGVHSARYGGPDLTDEDRTALILSELRNVPHGDRKARYCCALALTLPDGRVWRTEGFCKGVIASSQRGTGGFGYDPIFLLPEIGVTMAELSDKQKNSLSHRARAVHALRDALARTPIGELQQVPSADGVST
jgi:XTP/dITP diphosphohydrolase